MSLRQISLKAALAALALAVLFPALLAAQDDADDAPLGDVARNLRKKSPSSQGVIDNDNLTDVMDGVESRRPARASLLYSIFGGGKSLQVSAPDVTCSLSFSGNTKSLLSSQYVQLDLPASDLPKLEGPAAIDGDSLAISVFNATDWHISELAVALTVVKRAPVPGMALYFPLANPAPPASDGSVEVSESPTGHPSDLTVLYRIRAAAPPNAATVFRTPLNMEIGPDQEWHWAIVQAKGYPPQRPAEPSTQAANLPLTAPAPLPVPGIPQTSSAVVSPLR